MKFTILFACFLFAVASADHNPFDVLPVDVSGPEDRVAPTPDDWVAALDRTTTPKAVVPIDLGTSPGSTAAPEEPTSTTEQPEEPTSTVVTDSPTTVEPTDSTPTEQPSTTEAPASTTEVVPSSTVTDAPTENPTTSNPTENPSTENPSTENPSTENPSTENPSTENPSTANPSTKNPSTETPTTEKPSGEAPKGWSTGSIAGIVIGSLFGAAMVVGGILFASHRMRQRRAGDRRPLVEA